MRLASPAELLFRVIRAEVVPGLPAVFVSCPLLTRQILASEGRYPVHLVPQAWTVFNSRHGRRRGLFFLDGEEWWQSRRRLNPLFLKQQSLARLHSVVEDKTEDLIRGWRCGDNVTGLEAQLYSWSTSTMLGAEDFRLKLKLKYSLSSSRYSLRR